MASGAIQAGAEHQGSAIMAAANESGAGADCDCGSCHAPAPPQLAIAGPNAPASGQPADDPGIAPTTTRAPLVPPPQRTA